MTDESPFEIADPKDRYEFIVHMLETLLAPARPLSRWEMSFLESVGNQFERSSELSDRQFEVLERIYGEKTA